MMDFPVDHDAVLVQRALRVLGGLRIGELFGGHAGDLQADGWGDRRVRDRHSRSFEFGDLYKEDHNGSRNASFGGALDRCLRRPWLDTVQEALDQSQGVGVSGDGTE